MQIDEINGLTYPFENKPEYGEMIEVAKDVFWARMPLPMSLKWINIWLLRDNDDYVIIDTGMKSGETESAWNELFANSLKGAKISRIIATHMHPDHVGMIGWLCDKTTAPLFMSRLEYITCRMLVADTGRAAPSAAIEFYEKAGWGEAQIKDYREKFGGFGRIVHQLPDTFHRIEDGDIIEIGANKWLAIGANGHSPEHICLYCEKLGVLISGDQILPKISPNVSVFPTEPFANPLKDFLDSCAKLRKILPEDTLILPSHIAPFTGAHNRLDALIAHHQTALERLFAFCIDEGKNVIDCCSVLFKKAVTSDAIGMATGEAIAHLNFLIAEGKMTRREIDGVNLYQSIKM